MPKPHGTYIRVKREEKIKQKAIYNKANVSVKNKLKKKLETLRDIDVMQRKMAVIQDWINNGALSSKTKEEEIRNSLSDGIEFFDYLQAEIKELGQAYQELVQVNPGPAYRITRGDINVASQEGLMTIAIFLCKILYVYSRHELK